MMLTIDGSDLNCNKYGNLKTTKENLDKIIDKLDQIGFSELIDSATIFGGFALTSITGKEGRTTGDVDLYVKDMKDKFFFEMLENMSLFNKYDIPIENVMSPNKEVEPAVEIFTRDCIEDCFSTFKGLREKILENNVVEYKNKYNIVSPEGFIVLKGIGAYDDKYKNVSGKDPQRHKNDVLNLFKHEDDKYDLKIEAENILFENCDKLKKKELVFLRNFINECFYESVEKEKLEDLTDESIFQFSQHNVFQSLY